MATLNEELKSRNATSAELIELQKAMQTTTTADVMITIDYDAELQKLVYHQAPFLSYCEQSGLVSPASVDKVGYRVKEQKTKSTFIGETEDIPAHDASIFTDKVAKMKTLVYPIEVSDLSEHGVDGVDLLQDEINDGYLDMAATKDKTILQGDGTKKDFEGLFPTITSHVEDNSGKVLEKDTLDILAQDIIDDGGSPSAIVTTAKVGRQLNDILYPSVREIKQIEMGLGYWVTQYNAPNGQAIPIIVDSNIDTTDGDYLAVIDNNSLRIRELQSPMIAPLAKTKLSTSQVIFTWFTFYNRAQYQNGLIKNIGDEE